MATPDVVYQRNGNLLSSPLLDQRNALVNTPESGEGAKFRGLSIEKKIEFLESITGQVSNRRSRRWLNDRLLMELVPRLDAEEIRGLFAPPPWGDEAPLSPFCMTNVEEWDKFRTIDMDKEAYLIDALNRSCAKKKGRVNTEKLDVLNAWLRVNCETREALRRSFRSELITGYEQSVRCFIEEGRDEDVLVLRVQDPFQRLLLHGVCEFYDLVSVTVDVTEEPNSVKMTRIKKKKSGSKNITKLTISQFLKMSRDGF